MKKNCINSLFYNILQTARICQAFCENYFKEYAQGEISYDEFIIIDTVLSYPDICQRDLAKKILKGTSHLSKILSALERKGLIERPISKKGNRVVRKIIITENGINLHCFASQIALDFSSKIEDAIGANGTINCTQYLKKIKTTVLENTEIVFE